jgi:glycosyltransferase involved in cell wall biosynthesis
LKSQTAAGLPTECNHSRGPCEVECNKRRVYRPIGRHPSREFRSIALVLHTYLPESYGGAEQQARRYSAGLAARKLGVHILAPRTKAKTPRYECVGMITVRRFRTKNLPNLGGRYLFSFLAWSIKLIVWLVQNRRCVDLIHVVHGRLHAVPAVLAGLIIRKPVVVKIGRGGDQFDLRVVRAKRLLGPVFARLISSCTSAFVANSREIAADLAACGISAARVHRIPNGVELREPVEHSFGSRRSPRMVYLGRLDPEKAIDLMIRGLSLVPPSIRPQLDLVGDGSMRHELDILSQSLGLESYIRFAGAVIDVEPYLRQSSFYVSTSLSEGMSNALLEAMSFGMVPIVSRVSGAADVISHGRSGFLFEAGSIDAFVAALRSALALAPEDRLSMGRAAWDTIRLRFSIESVVDRHLELYAELLSPP